MGVLTRSPHKVLLAGATGLVGRAVARRLVERGYNFRTLSRNPHRSQTLQSLTTDRVVGDATRPRTLQGVMDGVDAVISCLGAPIDFTPRERRGFGAVDTVANRNLIQAAVEAGVSRFVYVAVHAQPGYADTAYIRAHEAVVDELEHSRISAGVVRPTGLFPIFDVFVAMARWGVAVVPGRGTARTNPVHPLDVADACVEALDKDDGYSTSIGGPDLLTRGEIVELAFTALKKRPRIVHVPPGLALAGSAALHPLHPRLGETIDFAARVFTTDCEAPQRGRRRLVDHFKMVAEGARGVEP